MMHVLAFENDSLAYCVKMLMHQRFLQSRCICMLYCYASPFYRS